VLTGTVSVLAAIAPHIETAIVIQSHFHAMLAYLTANIAFYFDIAAVLYVDRSRVVTGFSGRAGGILEIGLKQFGKTHFRAE